MEHWASLAIGFGLGNLALSHVRYVVLIGWVVVSVGALLKAIVHSRLSYDHTDKRPNSKAYPRTTGSHRGAGVGTSPGHMVV